MKREFIRVPYNNGVGLTTPVVIRDHNKILKGSPIKIDITDLVQWGEATTLKLLKSKPDVEVVLIPETDNDFLLCSELCWTSGICKFTVSNEDVGEIHYTIRHDFEMHELPANELREKLMGVIGREHPKRILDFTVWDRILRIKEDGGWGVRVNVSAGEYESMGASND